MDTNKKPTFLTLTARLQVYCGYFGVGPLFKVEIIISENRLTSEVSPGG